MLASGWPVQKQARASMNSKENEKMVAEFKAHAEGEGAVLLGVQGGRSSEGVDYAW